MTAYEKLQARIAAIRSRIDAGQPARLPTWRNKPKTRPLESGETRSRAPGAVHCSAKPPDAAGSPYPSLGDAGGVVPSEPVVPVRLVREPVRTGPTFRGSCKAVCALSGRRCQLPAHGTERSHHDGRRGFFLVAMPDQKYFPERERLDAAATHRNEVFSG